MTENCSTCAIPVKERPGCIIKCVNFSNVVLQELWHFRGHQPKEEKREPWEQWEAWSAIAGSKQRTCGNCGWHGEHGHNGSYALCGWSNTAILKDNHKQDEICQWKPINPECETCGGIGKVCDRCDIQLERCGCYGRSAYLLKPCPTCSEEKPKRLMVPCAWIDMTGYDRWYFGPVALSFSDSDSLALVKKDKEKYVTEIGKGFFSKKIGTYDTLKAAKTAAEKALGVEDKI